MVAIYILQSVRLVAHQQLAFSTPSKRCAVPSQHVVADDEHPYALALGELLDVVSDGLPRGLAQRNGVDKGAHVLALVVHAGLLVREPLLELGLSSRG